MFNLQNSRFGAFPDVLRQLWIGQSQSFGVRFVSKIASVYIISHAQILSFHLQEISTRAQIQQPGVVLVAEQNFTARAELTYESVSGARKNFNRHASLQVTRVLAPLALHEAEHVFSACAK